MQQSHRDVQTSVQRALGTGATQTINYTYDNIDQLIGEVSTESTPLLNNSYNYDSAGNRTASSAGGTESAFTLDEMNQISGYTLGGNAVAVDYDDNGNTIQIGNQFMAYDDADRLTSVVQVNPATQQNVIKTEYVYDGLGRRSIARTYSWDAGNSSWIQQNERRFIYDGMDLIQERDGSNNVIASYVRDGNIGGALSRTTSSGTFYYHYDGNGNVVAMTNTSGTIVAEYTYDAYGNLTSMSGSEAADNPIRFSTKYFDGNTGYYDFGFRSYDPVTGRWLNRDPIGEEGGLNLYGFVGNSPGNRVDAYGLDPNGHGRGRFVVGNTTYYGSKWVHTQVLEWQRNDTNLFAVGLNHGGGGEYDYKNQFDPTYNRFWVNNRWLSPGGFGNYAAGYGGEWAGGNTGVVLTHGFGNVYEGIGRIFRDPRDDEYNNYPWYKGDPPPDYRYIEEGAYDAAQYKAHLKRLRASKRKVVCK